MHRYYLNIRSVVSVEGAEDATSFPISYVTNICTWGKNLKDKLSNYRDLMGVLNGIQWSISRFSNKEYQ